MESLPNERDIPFEKGRQVMIRRFDRTRRVRVEVESVISFEGLKTITVFGRHIRRNHQGGGVVVGNLRSWSTTAALIDRDVEQIS